MAINLKADNTSIYHRSSCETDPAVSYLLDRQEISSTHCFQVVLHDVPGWLHHLKHHVVLDVLHKVEHALSEGKRGSKPAKSMLEQCVHEDILLVEIFA